MKKQSPFVVLPAPVPNEPEPFSLFRRWYLKAERSKIKLPHAMTLATVKPDGAPSARIVLLKQFDADGLVFYTNYDSDKGRELEGNSHAAVVFYWPLLDRQIRVEGRVERVAPELSDAYFDSRPRGYQLGAWASDQSRAYRDKEGLLRRFLRTTAKYRRKPVPRPEHWGGYRLVPSRFEFWESRANRLHLRRVFTRTASGRWKMHRLYP